MAYIYYLSDLPHYPRKGGPFIARGAIEYSSTVLGRRGPVAMRYCINEATGLCALHAIKLTIRPPAVIVIDKVPFDLLCNKQGM